MSIPPEQVGAQETNGMGYFIWCSYPTDEQPVTNLYKISNPPPQTTDYCSVDPWTTASCSVDPWTTDYCSVWPLDNTHTCPLQLDRWFYATWFPQTCMMVYVDPLDRNIIAQWPLDRNEMTQWPPEQQWNDTVTPWTAIKWHSDTLEKQKFWDHPIHLWRGGGGMDIKWNSPIYVFVLRCWSLILYLQAASRCLETLLPAEHMPKLYCPINTSIHLIP